MATRGKGAWLAALAAAAAAACAAHAPVPPPQGAYAPPSPEVQASEAEPAALPPTDLARDPAPDLEPPPSSEDRIELSALLFDREDHPRLLKERLLISGIDPHEVGQFLEAYNRRSELIQFTPDGVAFAPHALEHMLSLSPTQILQFRFSGQAGKFIFRFTWK